MWPPATAAARRTAGQRTVYEYCHLMYYIREYFCISLEPVLLLTPRMQAYSFVQAGINLMHHMVGQDGLSWKMAEPLVNSYETALRISVLLKKYEVSKSHLNYVRQVHGRSGRHAGQAGNGRGLLPLAKHPPATATAAGDGDPVP